MRAKRKLTDTQKTSILNLSPHMRANEIGRRLGLDPRSVNGYIMTDRNMSAHRLSSAPTIKAPAPRPWTHEDAVQALEKMRRTDLPDAEFSMQAGKGRKVQVSVYKGGIVLKIGKSEDVAFLVMGAADQLGKKLSELSHWNGLYR